MNMICKTILRLTADNYQKSSMQL